MKIKLLSVISFLAIASGAVASINVTVPENCVLNSFDYYYAPIKQYSEAKTRSERGVIAEQAQLNDGKAVLAIPEGSDGYMYVLNIKNDNIRFYAAPGDEINVNVVTCDPVNYSISGTGLVDGINEINLLEAPIMLKAKELNESGQSESPEMEKLAEEYVETQKKFIKENSNNPAVPVALLNLEGQDFIDTYEAINETIKGSILYPLVAKQYETEKKGIEMEKKQQALQNGDVNAPNFTLKDLEGKDVSLSDFKGKWVILDFWGSWCPWCIKGFPELKEAYSKYKGELEIIGIDCNEGEKEWRAGVETYQLPWVNVYNPSDSKVLSEYGVQGFPTKAIINPEGKIVNITVGHKPDFFNILDNLIGK